MHGENTGCGARPPRESLVFRQHPIDLQFDHCRENNRSYRDNSERDKQVNEHVDYSTGG
jgi:hypothetical protein